MNPNSNPPIRKDAQLKVHVVDAQNLGNVEYGHVNMSQGDTQSETENAPNDAMICIWNEAIIFKITDEHQPLRLKVLD